MAAAGGQPARRMSPAFAGAMFMVLAALGFSGMNVLVRLAAAELHPFQVAFLRFLFGACFAVPWLLRQGGGWRSQRLGLHALRACLTTSSALLWFSAVSLLPLAQAVSLNFTAPLFATIGAALFLGEVVRVRRWTATALGFVGVLIIVRPGVTEVSPAMALPLLAAATMTVSVLFVKVLTRTESAPTILFYMNVLPLPFLLVFALFVWQAPSPLGWGLGVAMGALGVTAHFFFTRAFAIADASYVIPFDYVRLPFIAVIAFFAFGEVPDVWTWVGAGVIAGSAIYIARREAQLARAGRASRRPVTGSAGPGGPAH